MFTKSSNITDFRPSLCQWKNTDKKELSKLYGSLNQVKLMEYAFEPNYRKILFTEYTLNASFLNVSAARTYESFNLRILK